MFDVAMKQVGKRVSTPGWLLRAAAAIVLVAVLAAGATLWTAAGIGEAAQAIGRDAEPSVALALRMTSALAGLNAAAIGDSLTDTGTAAGTSRAFRDGTVQLGDDVVAAARNITYGEAEAGPLRALQQALAMYQEAVVESRYIGAGNAWITTQRVQWASRVNRLFAAPAAQALADANAGVLEQRYATYQSTWLLQALAGLGLFGLLLALLAVVQVWLVRRMRRLVNPPLAAATLLCAAAALWFGSEVLTAHGALRGAKQDAYDSLHVLFAAKSAVSGLRAEASLWLLDPATRASAAGGIAETERLLIGEAGPDPASRRALVDGLGAALVAEQAGDPAGAKERTPKTGGLIGTELANVTYGMPERQAATDAATGLLAADAMVRSVQAQAAQDHAAAVARWLSERPGGGVPSFSAVQAALDRCIEVNQAAFDRDTATALSLAGSLAPVTLAALTLAALLALGGLWLRLREYR